MRERRVAPRQPPKPPTDVSQEPEFFTVPPVCTESRAHQQCLAPRVDAQVAAVEEGVYVRAHQDAVVDPILAFLLAGCGQLGGQEQFDLP